MKKFTAIFLCLCLFVVLCGCGEEAKSSDSNSANLVKQYSDAADKYVSENDYETAIKALEEGVEKTGSKELKKKLEDLKAENEKYNKLLGTYEEEFGPWITISLYKSGGKLKAYVNVDEYYGPKYQGGYFDVTEKDDGSYEISAEGTARILENGNKKIISLFDITNCYFRYLPDKLTFTPSEDGTKITIQFYEGSAPRHNYDLIKKADSAEFEEKYY